LPEREVKLLPEVYVMSAGNTTLKGIPYKPEYKARVTEVATEESTCCLIRDALCTSRTLYFLVNRDYQGLL
jgi:hypothetical protein